MACLVGTTIALVLCVIDTALLLGSAVLLGQRATVNLWVVAVFAALVYWLWRKNIGYWSWIALLVFGFLGWYRANEQLQQKAYEREIVRDSIGHHARCEGIARVVSSPIVRNDTWVWDGELSNLVCEEHPTDVTFKARLYGIGELTQLHRDDRVEVVIQIGPTQLFVNPNLPDPRPSSSRSAIAASGSVLVAEVIDHEWTIAWIIDFARNRVRQRIIETYGQSQALGRALVLGETDLDAEEDEAFRNAGLSHLLAVSGTHLVLFVVTFAKIIRWLLVRLHPISRRYNVNQLATALGVLVSFLYADFAGGSGSAKRAAWMLAVSLGAQAIARRSSGTRALGLSALVMCLIDPLAAFDISLLLSLAATSGLMALCSPVESKLNLLFSGRFSFLVTPLATSISASCACSPLLSSISPSLSLIGVVANLIAVPIGETLALPFCLIHTLLFWIPPIEQLFASVGAGALQLLRLIALYSVKIPGATISVPPMTESQTVILLGGALMFWTFRSYRSVVGAVIISLLLFAEGWVQRQEQPKGVLRVTVLDVGQGDSTLIDLPDGSTMLIDGGGFVGSPVDPGKQVILPILRARRRSKIDIMALSHPHPDHFMGLASTAPKINIGQFWDTGQGQDEGAGPVYSGLIQCLKDKQVPIYRPERLCGEKQDFAGALVEVLAPCPSYTPMGHANDNSLVIRIRYGQKKVLLVGDAEHEEEEKLLAAYGDSLKADLLKIGHHGSRTSSSRPFLQAVRPSAVTISTGVRNRFGHPHPKTLQTLFDLGIPSYRTDLHGSISWVTDGVESKVRPMMQPF